MEKYAKSKEKKQQNMKGRRNKINNYANDNLSLILLD